MAHSGWRWWFPKLLPAAFALGIVAVLVLGLSSAVRKARRAAQAADTT